MDGSATSLLRQPLQIMPEGAAEEGSFLQIGELLPLFTPERLCLSKMLFLHPVKCVSCTLLLQLFILSTTYFSSLLLPLSQLF